MVGVRWTFLFVCLALVTGVSSAEVPYPTCESAGCTDPSDFGSYLFLQRGQLPNDFDRRDSDSWKYRARSGLNVVRAWRITTGRPDVVIAILDSGIRWNKADLAASVALNEAELPVPVGCAEHDCNGDGFVSIVDFTGTPDRNGNGLLDGQDLIYEYSDGIDDDNNGYVDDIAGWDFYQDDNDPFDDVDHGHGTSRAEEMVAEANNGGGTPGFAPSSLFLPLRVADSFIAVGSDFAQAVVYAVDRRVSLISEALGALSATPTSQGAIDYAYRRGIPMVASAADEQERHHNFPSGLEHTIWVNSIVHGDGVAVQQTRKFDLLNGCTNFGGRAWVAISSNACSSEATARAIGLVALLISHGKNLIDRGQLAPYPGLDTPFSAEEVRQLLRIAAEDIDHEETLDDLRMLRLLQRLLSAPMLGLTFESRRFQTQANWDQFTGYGRPNARRLLDVREDEIPPEADLSGSLAWFDTVDPAVTPAVPVVGSAAAVRRDGPFDYVVEAGCGVQPKSFTPIEWGSSAEQLDRAVLATWSPGDTAVACGFDPEAVIDTPDAHTVTLRLRVIDELGNVGVDRRTVAVHTDSSLRHPPLVLGGSAEGSPALVDIDGDGVLDLALGASDGAVHALRGDTLDELDGFPARTDSIPVHPSKAYMSGEVPIPHEAVLGATAADDLLPTIGTGTPGAPALADLDGSGTLKVAIFGTAGPVAIYDADGRSLLGQFAGRTRSLAMDFPDGFPRVPESAGSADAPFFAALGSGIFSDLDGNGLPEYVAPTAGLRKLLDVAAAAQQTLGDHQVTAWNPLDGSLVPAFPLPMDDAQFLCGPSLGDVDRDGLPEILQGSGSYLLRAFKNDGSQPEGWPKFTHGWLFCAPSAGDVDGDGLIEVIATTREGRLYIWNTPAPASEAGIPWQGFGRDRRNTQNLSSAVPTTVTPESPLLAADEGLVPRSRNSAAHGARDQP